MNNLLSFNSHGLCKSRPHTNPQAALIQSINQYLVILTLTWVFYKIIENARAKKNRQSNTEKTLYYSSWHQIRKAYHLQPLIGIEAVLNRNIERYCQISMLHESEKFGLLLQIKQ